MVDFYLALCRAASLGADDRRTELPYSEQDVHQATQFLRDAGVDPSSPLVLLHPAAGYGPAKRWTEAGWAELARMLDGELRAQVACIGAPSGQELTGRIVALSAAPVLDLTSCGIDLHLLKCIVRMSRLLVTTDSGPRHYGVALGVPTVCLMGPTHPGYSTSGRPNDHVVRVEVECGPCQRKACTTDHRCMALLTPELVMDACRTAIERGSEADGD
jgi:heptosyltransferase-2